MKKKKEPKPKYEIPTKVAKNIQTIVKLKSEVYDAMGVVQDINRNIQKMNENIAQLELADRSSNSGKSQ